MYDAKKQNAENESSLKSDCIKERGYFTNIDNGISIATKSSFIPVENLIQDFTN
jgi:hypothetical protein